MAGRAGLMILDQELWDEAPVSFRDHCRDKNPALAFVALRFGDDHPEFPGQYKTCWKGPRPDAVTVATNLDTWLYRPKNEETRS